MTLAFLITHPRLPADTRISPQPEAQAMATVTINDDADCYCKDWGEGRPVVFWPSSPAQAPTGDLQ